MAKTNADVANAFASGREANGGNMRSSNQDGLTVGFSYAEPVAIYDGYSATLCTIDHWSVTTARHVSLFRCVGWLPATTETLHAVVNGRMTFEEACNIGRAIREAANERERAKGVPLQGWKSFPGMKAVWNPEKPFTTDHYFTKQGKTWALVPADKVEPILTARTLKEARVAAWDALGMAPKGWPTREDARSLITA